VKVTANLGHTRVPAGTAATLFRVAQEALKSAEARARGGKAEILLYANNGTICLEVVDDTQELDSSAVMADNSRSGLATIRDRVALTGGVMRIANDRNGTTKVTAELRPTDEN